MYLIYVSPIARGISKETLTYFSQEQPALGSVVSIPLRSKKVRGIVIDVRSAVDEKSRIKSLGYELKKVDKLESKKIIRHSYIEAAHQTALWYASNLGSVLWNVLPHTILLKSTSVGAVLEKGVCPVHPNKKIVVRGNNEERWNTYRSYIRACFAKKQSAYITVPTIEDAEYAATFISRGIEQYTFILHGDLPEKKTIETWNIVTETKHPVLIIGTPAFLSVPRTDLGLVIIEREHSRAYRVQSRPFIDFRRFIETFADMIGADIIRGDNVVGIETWWRANRTEENIEYREEPSEQEATFLLVDMASYKVENGKPFVVLSDEIKNAIVQTYKNGKHIFLFTPRKGLYPTTVCADCGKTVTCSRCSAPVVVHENKEDTNFIFVCHHCSKERPTEERCTHCGSWRLAALGIGIERVTAEIKKLYPEIPLFIVDKNSEPTRSRVKKTIEAYYKTPGAILLGTEYALLYVREVEASAIISLDSLFLIPDFRMHERILGILATIRGRTTHSMYVQTRDPSHLIFETMTRKTLREFYIKEAELRKILGYPPFTLYIKITRVGKKENTEYDLNELNKKFEKYTTIIFPGHIERIKGMQVMHLIIKLRPDQWIDEHLAIMLRSLPPSFTVRVDPDTLL